MPEEPATGLRCPAHPCLVFAPHQAALESFLRSSRTVQNTTQHKHIRQPKSVCRTMLTYKLQLEV